MQGLEPMRRTGALRAARVLQSVTVCLAILLSVPGDTVAAGGQPADDDTLVWLDDYQAALALAQETGRPLLVEFRCAP